MLQNAVEENGIISWVLSKCIFFISVPQAYSLLVVNIVQSMTSVAPPEGPRLPARKSEIKRHRLVFVDAIAAGETEQEVFREEFIKIPSACC